MWAKPKSAIPENVYGTIKTVWEIRSEFPFGAFEVNWGRKNWSCG